MDEAQQMERKLKADCDRAFNSFMENPATKVLLSIAPPFEHMEQMLRAAYESGYKTGQAAIVVEMVGTIVSSKDMRR